MQVKLLGAAALIASVAATCEADAAACARWGPATLAGQLDTELVGEASGLEASDRFPGRLYHNNDSGDGLRFYVSDLSGANTRAVEVEGARPRDTEDLSLGPCGRRRTCLWLADIGDNGARRESVAFTLVEERAAFPAKVAPLRRIEARYPDGAHNAEAMAVHPNGDLFVVTKPVDTEMSRPGPAIVYRLAARAMRAAKGTLTFERLGEIDLPAITAALPRPAAIATALDIAPDGRRAILLTYMTALELRFDLAAGLPKAPWVAGRDYQLVTLTVLPQQEAVAWLPGARGFLYDTERARGTNTPIRRVDCADR